MKGRGRKRGQPNVFHPSNGGGQQCSEPIFDNTPRESDLEEAVWREVHAVAATPTTIRRFEPD